MSCASFPKSRRELFYVIRREQNFNCANRSLIFHFFSVSIFNERRSRLINIPRKIYQVSVERGHQKVRSQIGGFSLSSVLSSVDCVSHALVQSCQVDKVIQIVAAKWKIRAKKLRNLWKCNFQVAENSEAKIVAELRILHKGSVTDNSRDESENSKTKIEKRKQEKKVMKWQKKENFWYLRENLRVRFSATFGTAVVLWDCMLRAHAHTYYLLIEKRSLFDRFTSVSDLHQHILFMLLAAVSQPTLTLVAKLHRSIHFLYVY